MSAEMCAICQEAQAETLGLCGRCAPSALAEMCRTFDRWRYEEESDCSLEIHTKPKEPEYAGIRLR